MIHIHLTSILLIGFSHAILPNCTDSSLKLEATDCNSDGFRWVFKVPSRPDQCSLTNESLPVVIRNCGSPCSAGQYYDLRSMHCQNCQPGTYSGGETITISNWKSMPDLINVDVNYPDGYQAHCSKSNWKPNGEYAIGHAQPNCIVTMSIKVHFAQQGEVSFTYNIDNRFTMAVFSVRSDRCTQIPQATIALQATGENSFYAVRLPMKSGSYILQWMLYTEENFLRSMYGLPDSTMRLREIKITGTPTVFNCTPCVAGTFSDQPGSATCKQCPENTFSSETAARCIQCGSAEYARPGSTQCIQRLPCRSVDYKPHWTPCDGNEKTQKIYEWLEPIICNTRTLQLPAPERSESCESCPLGTEILNATHCTFCGVKSTWSSCVTCRTNQVAVFGLTYDKWSRWPPHISTSCEAFLGGTCKPWSLFKNYIWSGPGNTIDATSILELDVPDGFMKEYNDQLFGQNNLLPDTNLRFEFEISCHEYCTLVLEQVSGLGKNTLLMTWVGNHTRKNYTFPITDSASTKFVWKFRKMDIVHHAVMKHSYGEIKIFSISLSNVKNSGVIGCRDCPLGIKDGRCISCPRGNFIALASSNETKKAATSIICASCPPKTIVISNPFMVRTAEEACVPCAPGMTDFKRLKCVIDSSPKTDSGMIYNFTQLVTDEKVVKGLKLFTPTGVAYNYEFHLTLNPYKTVRCEANATQAIVVESLICRETAVHSHYSEDVVSYLQPISLGDHLLYALQTNSSRDFWTQVNNNLSRAGWAEDAVGTDMHYFFKTQGSTPGCPDGRLTVLTLRCGLNVVFDQLFSGLFHQGVKHSLLQLPPNCPSGTCDGCVYHLMWLSVHACPFCSEESIGKFYGECKLGKQEIQLYPLGGCRLPSNMTTITSRRCPLMTTTQAVATIMTVVIVIILVAIILICRQKNRRLKYKYMKLVEASKAQPTSCALDDSEETTSNFGTPSNTSFSHVRFDGGVVLSPNKLVKAALSKFSFKNHSFVDDVPVVFKKTDNEDCIVLPENEVTEPHTS